MIVTEKIVQKTRKKKRKGCLRENMVIIPKTEDMCQSDNGLGKTLKQVKKQQIEKKLKD
jgi:hypothetical protein